MTNKIPEPQDSYTIEIKGGASMLQIVLLERLYPNASDKSDKDIISAEVRFSTGHMHGKCSANIWSAELEALKNLFIKLQTNVGEALNEEFEFMEEAVKFNISTSKTGQIDTEVTVCPNPAVIEYAKFILDLDQSYLPNIINTLEEALVKFPKGGNQKF